MLVIGIDPGTATTGYGLVREAPDGSLSAVAYGVIKTAAKTPMPQRLAQLHEQLVEIQKLHRADTAAVEKLFFQTNVKTAITVAQGRGVALLALAQSGLEIGEYTPSKSNKPWLAMAEQINTRCSKWFALCLTSMKSRDQMMPLTPSPSRSPTFTV